MSEEKQKCRTDTLTGNRFGQNRELFLGPSGSSPDVFAARYFLLQVSVMSSVFIWLPAAAIRFPCV